MVIRHAKDNTFKLILGNHQLFVEFLRDFIPLPLLKSVQPDDVEDLSERFLPLALDGRDSDTVKRIRLPGDTPLFVIAIVEHESKVNFRAPFKMLQYLTLVLADYEKEADRRRPGSSAAKEFRYPPVLPVVFYDGSAPWTAERDFRRRTALAGVFGKYIPSFEYELVDLNQYRQEDLAAFGDALSFIMIIDKIRTKEGLSLLRRLPEDYVEQLHLKIPENLTRLLTDAITVLLDRLQVPREEIGEVTDFFEKKEYQTMFDALVESVLEDKRLAVEEAVEKTQEEDRETARREKLEIARKLRARGLSGTEIADILNIDPGELPEHKGPL